MTARDLVAATPLRDLAFWTTEADARVGYRSAKAFLVVRLADAEATETRLATAERLLREVDQSDVLREQFFIDLDAFLAAARPEVTE